LNLVFIAPFLLRGIDHGRILELKSFKFQVIPQTKIKDLKSRVIDWLHTPDGQILLKNLNSPPINYGPLAHTDDYRLWKLDPLVSLQEAHKYMKNICNRTPYDDYRIPFKGICLEKDQNISLEEANVAESDYVIIELRELGMRWHFQGDEAPSLDKCDFCKKYELILKYSCACKKEKYCSEECRRKPHICSKYPNLNEEVEEPMEENYF